MNNNILIINPEQDIHILKGLASDIRIKILQYLTKGPVNINTLVTELDLPQSTVTTNIQTLEQCGLVTSKIIKGVKGNQKICENIYAQFFISFQTDSVANQNAITVEMPIGLFIDYNVAPPCGMCSSSQIIGFLDTPSSFLEPERVKAGLLWFGNGYVQYKFPNNAYSKKLATTRLELSMELSSEIPETDPHWKSDIQVAINGNKIGTWTAPGDYGDKRGKYTPDWWKNNGSQYGILTTWNVTQQGTYIDTTKISKTTISDLNLNAHHSINVSIEVDKNAQHAGGINIFGKGFGNYDQDIVLRMFF
jgi:predicted transcriptional regulator